MTIISSMVPKFLSILLKTSCPFLVAQSESILQIYLFIFPSGFKSRVHHGKCFGSRSNNFKKKKLHPHINSRICLGFNEDFVSAFIL
eukprot:m.233908 g.233908  ORF g.233908 m.233908 type:complete len:87 (-) comp16030_c0_seq16:1383-1643(-)